MYKFRMYREVWQTDLRLPKFKVQDVRGSFAECQKKKAATGRLLFTTPRAESQLRKQEGTSPAAALPKRRTTCLADKTNHPVRRAESQ